jgi:hypothetical protein
MTHCRFGRPLPEYPSPSNLRTSERLQNVCGRVVLALRDRAGVGGAAGAGAGAAAGGARAPADEGAS